MSLIMTNSKHAQVKEYLWTVWENSERYGNYIVKLSDKELELARDIGKKRYDINRQHFSKKKKHSSSAPPSLKRDYLGACGELAAIKWLKENGYQTNEQKFLEIRDKGEADEFDTDIVFDGETLTVEVKTTEKPVNSKLIYPLHKGKKEVQPDIFLLVCHIDEHRHVIKGFTTSENVLEYIDEALPSKAYSIHENNLSSNIEEVIQQIHQKKELQND